MEVQGKDPKSLIVRFPDHLFSTTSIEAVAKATARVLEGLDDGIVKIRIESLVYLRNLTHLPPGLRHLDIQCADLVTDEGLEQLGRCVSQLRHLKTFRMSCHSVQTCSNEAVARLATEVPNTVTTLELRCWISLTHLEQLPGSLENLTLFACNDRGHAPDCTNFLNAYGERRGWFHLYSPEIDGQTREILTRAVPQIKIHGPTVHKRRRCSR